MVPYLQFKIKESNHYFIFKKRDKEYNFTVIVK
jgi:hypothetical protein